MDSNVLRSGSQAYGGGIATGERITIAATEAINSDVFLPNAFMPAGSEFFGGREGI